ncbi:MAG: Calx-beta domain-containing protein, partial [Maribacter sp.]|uniref:Calx-beta domain-containing protein n=1 Tax=Maribacter sp. TaxID=1897614 RepID=UPI003C7631E9
MKHSISKSNTGKIHLADKMGKLILLVFFLLTTFVSAQVKKAFTPRYNETIKGDVTIIANNMLSAHKTNSFNATGDNQDSNNRVYVDIDSDPSTFNSSSATLNDPAPGLNCKEFVRAYLYWAASDKEAGGVSQNADSWNHDKVKLMLPGSSTYTTITADEVIYRGRPEHFHNDPYICVKDITSDVVALTNPYGKYQVGNVQATYGGLEPHGGGNYGVAGGWQIVFVYQSTDLLTRNITLFDGYAHVDNEATTDFNVNGFLSIPSGPVKADIILGSIEGDRVLNGDSFQIKKPDNTWQKISTPLRGQDNFFSSTISIDGAHFVSRNPASTNTLGYDASIFELSNPGNSLITNNQTSTTLRATSGQESYGLYLVGFSIEVYEPSLGALKFTTSPLNSTYDAGDLATLSMSIENSGNDNIASLQITTILPMEVEYDETQPLPTGVTSASYNDTTRALNFIVDENNVEAGDPEFLLDFDVTVKEQCYFLETACSATFSLQATATFTGEINPETQTTNSSGTLNECGFGNFDPTVVNINQPAQVNWSTLANALDTTVTCDDTASLNAAQSLEPATEFCDFTLDKTSGDFVPNADCDAEGTYTNTWTFTDACGRISDTFTQVITIEDHTDPTFNEALPTDTVAAYDNIPSPTTLTASDTCDTSPQVVFVETYNGDNNSTAYTIIRTWTALDCAGNSTEHVQYIYVTENGDPIGIAINDISIDENVGTATFKVVLTGIHADGFTLDYASNNGSAVAPGDYTSVSGTLAFLGDHNESFDIVVPILDDSLIENTETFTVELSAPSTNVIAINDASGLGTILDNDSATVSISDLDVDENAGVINVQVILSGNVQESFTVDYATADGTALSGLDYNNVNAQLTFPANSINGSFQNIPITIIDDDLIEITENFLVNLSNITATGNVTIADNQANVNITDNDAIAGTGISFTDTNVIVTEGTDAFAIFNVTLTGNITENVTVDYTTNEGTAFNPSDFVTTTGTLEFTPTVNSLDIQVPITDDAVIEPTEAFTVVLSNINSNMGIGFVDGNSTNTANGTILDD